MTAKVTEYWDRPWYRRGFVAVALAILAAGIAVTVARSHSGPAAPAALPPATSPFRPTNPTAKYGHVIPTPPSVMVKARRFVKDAVLREHPGATWSMVTPTLRQGISHADWRSGNIPVPEFPRDRFAGAGYKVLRSRQREVLLALTIASTNPLKVHFIQTFIEFRRSGGAWKVSYVGPRGGGPPVPAASP